MRHSLLKRAQSQRKSHVSTSEHVESMWEDAFVAPFALLRWKMMRLMG
jgi:hypothetical protein